MYVCTYVENERVCQAPYHLWAQMWHPQDPPPLLLEAQKHVGGYISSGQVKYFWKISCPNPPKKNIPGSNGGIIETIQSMKTPLRLVFGEFFMKGKECVPAVFYKARSLNFGGCISKFKIVLLNSYFELWRLYFAYSKTRYWILENAGRRAQANMNVFTSLHPNPPQPHPSIHNPRKLGEI